jgi:hypothetical protein
LATFPETNFLGQLSQTKKLCGPSHGCILTLSLNFGEFAK